MRAHDKQLEEEEEEGEEEEGEEMEDAMEGEVEEMVVGAAGDLEVDVLLARRHAPTATAARPRVEYLVKFKGLSCACHSHPLHRQETTKPYAGTSHPHAPAIHMHMRMPSSIGTRARAHMVLTLHCPLTLLPPDLHVGWRTETALARVNPKVIHRLKAFNRASPPLPPLAAVDEADPIENLITKPAPAQTDAASSAADAQAADAKAADAKAADAKTAEQGTAEGPARSASDGLLPLFDTLELLPAGAVDVEQVLAVRRSERRDGESTARREYFVKWTGLSYAESTWEPEGTFLGVEPAYRAYLDAIETPCVPPAAKDAAMRPLCFTPLDKSPVFEAGRTLRPYQLEGEYMAYTMHARMHACMHTCMHACTHTHTHTRAHACMHA